MIIEVSIFAAGIAVGFAVFSMVRMFASKSSQKPSMPHVENGANVRDYVSELKSNAEMWNVFSNALPIHVFIKNADDNFKYVYSNKTRNDFYGMKDGELVGRNDTSLLSPSDAEKRLSGDREIIEKPRGIYEEFVETVDSNGKKVCFRIAQTQFTDTDGTRLLLGAALDVTELVESRRELSEAKRRIEEKELWLSRTLHSIGDAVIVTDKRGNIVMLNPVAEKMAGVKSGEAEGKPHTEFFRIVGSTDGEPRESPVVRALRTGSIVELANHTDLVSKTGEHFHISDSAAPILDERGEVLGAVLVFRDITEAYMYRAALRDSVRGWEMASSVANIAFFRIDYKTGKISGSKRLSEFWPIKNGIAVPPEEWVLPEDLQNGHDIMVEVAAGKRMHTFYKYRVRKDGKIRHYRIFGAIYASNKDEITGVIQDVTEAYYNESHLQNTREMWNRLIDALPLNFFAKKLDDDFRYTHCNQKFADFVGKTPEEIIGKTDAEIFGNPKDSAAFNARDRQIMKVGGAVNFTESVYGRSNTQTQFQTVKMRCIGPDGDNLLLGVSIDITELVALGRSHEVIRQGLEMLVSETDVNEGIAKAMKSVCEYIEVSRGFIYHFNLENKTVLCVREYCRKGESNLLDNLRDVPFSTGVNWVEHFKKECFFNIPDLQNRDNLKMLGPFYTSLIMKDDFRSLYCHRLIIDGKFWGYVGFAYKNEVRVLNKGELDFVQSAARFIELMIRHKRTQEELREAVIKANAAEQAKSKFLSTMSHEIRTPLNAVIGYSELLKDGTLPAAEQKDYLADISIAGNALLALINDILDLSKLEAGKMQFAKSATNFAELVREVMVVFRQKLKEKRLEGRVEIADLPRVKIDPLRVRQILFNLIGNAVKFTDNGSITVSAGFTADADGDTGTLRFSVADTGCGISEDDAKQLFKPFVQSSATVKTHNVYGGSGLGLVLVRKMLDFMDGTVSLKSELGKGSEFSVEIKGVEYSYSAENSEEKDLSDEPEKVSPDCNVLLVDDMPMNLKVMRAMLKKIGVDCVEAANADEALAALQKQPFNVMLTDMWMPGINGVELAEKIRREGKYPKLGIALVTADTDSNPNFNSNLFDDVLTKPVTLKKLSHFIGKFC